jgi:hypothetical protein
MVVIVVAVVVMMVEAIAEVKIKKMYAPCIVFQAIRVHSQNHTIGTREFRLLCGRHLRVLE